MGFFTAPQRPSSRPLLKMATVEHRKAEGREKPMPNKAHSNPTEDPMTPFASTTIRHTLVSTFGALVLATALPQASLAAATSDDGLWRVNPAKSSLSSGSATLAIERAKSANPGAGNFIVVAKGSVYLVQRASAGDSNGLQPADYARMTSKGSAVLIGINARSADTCGFRCQGGLSESRIALTFTPVKGANQQINEMLAQGN